MMNFQIVWKNPSESIRETYTFAPGVVGFYVSHKYVEKWEQGKGWVMDQMYQSHTAVTLPDHIKEQAISRAKGLGWA